jgi:hypothetical protein
MGRTRTLLPRRTYRTVVALEAECRPFGPKKQRRSVVATTDPAELPDLTTRYLVTNLPAPRTKRAEESELSAADVAEVVRTYSLRSWIEQSYKQIKHPLGWSHYHVRKDVAIRRHWQLVMCTFTFCWLGKRRRARGGGATWGGSRERRGRLNFHFCGGKEEKGSSRAGFFRAGRRC